MHKICSEQIKPEIHLYLRYQWPHRSAPNESVLCCLRQTQNKDLLGTEATFFFILTSILIEQINSCEINQDGQNVVSLLFFKMKIAGFDIWFHSERH